MMSSSGSTENENLSLGRRIIHDIQTKKSVFWEKERKTRALSLFHDAAREVPAYKDFLKKNHIRAEKIKTFEDFQNVPPVSKKNYLRQYPIEKLIWGGNLKKKLTFTSTSGSTGAPFYFPRSDKLEWEGSLIHEMFLANSAARENSPVLVVVCFSMGVWIGGLLTYKGYEIAAKRGNYAVSIIAPGINKKEIWNALRQLSPHYSETILVGYPPFIKDVIDGAKVAGVDLKKLHLRLSFAAEAFTENFRNYLVEMGGVKNPYLDTMNIYGSAEIGAMGFETPLAILIRRMAVAEKSNKIFKAIFGDISKTPTLAQYNPFFITFEAPGGEVLLTGDNTIPLIRYAIGDHGGTMSFKEMEEKYKSCGESLGVSVRRQGLQKYVSELPFVYVYERNDFSTTLYGLQIYPEHIKEALIHNPVRKFVTGKFIMTTKFDKKQNQYLEINLEMLPQVKITARIRDIILEEIIKSLRRLSSEFRELHKYLAKRVLIRLIFLRAEDPIYFRPGIKQPWIKK